VATLAVALDVASLNEARVLSERVASHADMLKVGLELFVSEGPAVVAMARALKPVFLDLKLHDIPETVDRAVARCAALGARLVTIHAAGGPAMLERAADRARKEGGIDVIAVTVLTSLSDDDLAKTGVSAGTKAQAIALARLAWSCGVRYFVCSPHEARDLRGALGKDAVLVTPGIRASGGADDQKRVATASEAVRAGADILVVGRPIRDANDPSEAARSFAAEIHAG
jgi:orotidine-5'-phosphate decarboxylase